MEITVKWNETKLLLLLMLLLLFEPMDEIQQAYQRNCGGVAIFW